MGQSGSMARRNRSAAKPTTATAKPCLRANRPNARSIREKYREPSLGKQNASTTAITVKLNSIILMEGPWPGIGDRIIAELFASFVVQGVAMFGGSRLLRNFRII